MDLRELELLETKVQEAEDSWRTGDWRQALAIYCRVFSERWGQLEHHTDELSAADLTILERIADLSVPFGNADAADKLLEVAAQGYRRLDSQYWSDLITLKRIHVAFTNHDPFQARLLFQNLSGPLAGIEDAPMIEAAFLEWERAYPRSRARNDLPVLFTNFYLQLGRLLTFMGRYRFALAAFRRGRELAKQMGSHSGTIEIHLRLAAAGALLESGNLLAGQSALAEVSSRIEQTKHPGHYTAWLELSARVDLLHGNFGNAEQRLTQVWTVCLSQGFTLPALYAMLSLGELLVLLNRTVEARRLLAAITSEANHPENGTLSAEVDRLWHVADARASFGDAGSSSVLQMQTGDQLDQAPPQQDFEFRISTEGRSLDSFQARALQFQYYLGARRWLSAKKCLVRLRAFSNNESLLIRTRLEVLEAMYRYYTGDAAGALTSIREALPFFREQTLKPELWRAQDLYIRCLEKVDPSSPDQQLLAQQNHELLEELGESLPLCDRVLFLLNKPTHEEQELGRHIRQLQNLTSKEPSGMIHRVSRFFAVQKALNDILNLAFRQKAALTISRLAPGHEGGQQPWPRIALWKRLFLRSSREAALIFLVLPDSVLILTLIWGRLRFRIVRTPRLRLRELVRAWHETIGASRPDESNRLASLLGRELDLHEVLEELPSRVNRLVIVPDDALHGFPFAAIRVQNRYLLERFAISIAFQPEPRARGFGAGRIGEEPLLFGVTEGDPPLPRTLEQLHMVRDWLHQHGKQAPVRLNEEVSADSLVHLLQSASMAHISCHGEFVPDDPDRTGWQLCLGGGHTQTFGLPRLFGLDLKRLRHATLMSCWGADNYVLPGRWILSLPEVLWRAGAGSIAASLWEVSEDCALEFVRHFYEAVPHKRIDEALREAQLRMMRGENGAVREPIDWAGFQVYGEVHKLRI
jgi:CHAT domain-containing protein